MRAPEAPHVPDAPAAPARLREQQRALTRHLRDPRAVPAPAGIEERRLAVYRDLLFNNLEGLLAGNFPVIRALLEPVRWRELVRAFFRDHHCQTPLFPQIAGEFLGYLQARIDAATGTGDDPLPPFLAELAHYEWVELALQIAAAAPDDGQHDPNGDLLDGAPVVSPLAWAFAYRWPVHRLAPEFMPTTPPDAPTLLLLRRDPDGLVRFSELTAPAHHLLQRLADAPTLSGRAHLRELAAQADVAGDAAFIESGRQLLEQMRGNGVVLGTRIHPS